MVETLPFVPLADRRLNILLADDDPIHCAVAEQWLTEGGNELCVASDGREALAYTNDRTFDLVILDLEMPKMDGFDVLSELRADARHRRTPVVVITGRRDTFAIDKAYDRGATSFVVKPVVWPLLTRQLRYMLNAERMSRGLSALSSALA